MWLGVRIELCNLHDSKRYVWTRHDTQPSEATNEFAMRRVLHEFSLFGRHLSPRGQILTRDTRRGDRLAVIHAEFLQQGLHICRLRNRDGALWTVPGDFKTQEPARLTEM